MPHLPCVQVQSIAGQEEPLYFPLEVVWILEGQFSKDEDYRTDFQSAQVRQVENEFSFELKATNQSSFRYKTWYASADDESSRSKGNFFVLFQL